ncbi:MAG: lipoprotein [Pseudomonadota bacterium]
MKVQQGLVVALLLAFTVSACGQRGVLYLPGTPDPAEQTQGGPAEDEERDEEPGA